MPEPAEHLRRDPDLKFLTPAQVAERVGVSTKTLDRWRLEGTGPTFQRAGRRVLYYTASVIEWEDTLARTSTSEA